MKLHHEDIYPLPVADMLAVFTSRAFYDDRFASATGEIEFVEFGERGGRFVIDIRRHVAMRPGTHVPAIARKFIRDVNVTHTRMEWDLSKGETHRGTYRFHIEGLPVDISGNMHLEPRAGGCVERVDMTIACSIPLIGGKIASMAGERAEKALARDAENTRKYLRRAGLVTA